MNRKRKREESPPPETKKRCSRAVIDEFNSLPKDAQDAMTSFCRLHFPSEPQVADITCLTTLDLHLGVNNNVVQFVGTHMAQLQHLSLRSSPDLPQSSPVLDLQPLGKLQKLQSLSLHNCRFTGLEGWSGQMEALQKVNIHKCQAVSPHWVQHLSGVTSLTEVTLVRCYPKVTDQDVEALVEGHPQLNSLTIELLCEKFRLGSLAGMSRLEALHLRNCVFDEEHIEDPELPVLRKVHFFNCYPLKAVMSFLSDMRTLEEITLENCRLNHKALCELSYGRCRLRKLAVMHCSDMDVLGWRAIGSMSTLRQLVLKGKLLDEVLKTLMSGCLALESFAMEDCHYITHTGLKPFLLSQKKSLKTLSIYQCMRISSENLKNISENLLCLVTFSYVPYPEVPKENFGSTMEWKNENLYMGSETCLMDTS